MYQRTHDETITDIYHSIFSVGISVLELIAEVVLPTNGAMWHDLRNGKLPPTPGTRKICCTLNCKL